MIVVVAFLVSIFRYFAYPLGDIPDLCATIPDHLGTTLQLEITRLSCNAIEINPSGLLYLTLTGGIYEDAFDLPSFLLYIYSCLPYLIASISIQSLLSISPKYRSNSHPIVQKLALLIVAAPSTSYALISPKNEAFINSLGIIFFFAIVNLYISIDTRDAIRSDYIKCIPYLLLMPFALYLLDNYIEDNQTEIVLTFLALPIFLLLLKYYRIQPFSFISFSLGRLKVDSLITYICICLIAALVVYSPTYLPSLYTIFVNSAPKSIAFVASSGLSNQDIATKYPTLFRPVFTLLSLSFATASGYSIQVFSRAALILSIVAPFRNFLTLRRGLLDHQLIIVSLLVFLIALTVFPGYSNYKYWVFMAPLFFLPSALYSFRLPLILFVIIYAELFLKALSLQFS